MNYKNIHNTILQTPWLITPQSLQIILEIVDARRNGIELRDEELQAKLDALDGSSRTRPGPEAGGGVGVLPLYGPIFPKANMMTQMSGATSMESWKQDFREMMNNDRVQSIVMDVDSPGGSTYGIPEMAREIRAARDVKPIYAVANGGMIASAALYLASQATQMFASESSFVGSLGVLIAHEDQSQNDAKEGFKTTFIHAGKHKVEGNPHEPLSEAGKEYMQGIVDEIYGGFVQAVADGRNLPTETVDRDFGQGRMFTAPKALEVGMIDGIATLDEVLGEALGSAASVPAVAASTFFSFATNTTALPNPAVISATSTIAATWVNGVKAEHAEEEHSEPGTGTPPEPKPQPDQEQGYPHRYDSFPTQPATPTQEAAMNPEQLRALLTAAGIDCASMSDEQLTEEYAMGALAELNAEIQPLREARQSAEATVSFRDNYPEEFARMQRLEARDREASAKEFAGSFSRFKDAEGKTTNKGVSSLVSTQLEDAHKKIVMKQFGTDDLTAIVGSIGNGGIVEYGERGSSAEPENKSTGNAKMDFFNMVQDRVTEDSIPFAQALKLVAGENPEAYRAYESAKAVR